MQCRPTLSPVQRIASVADAAAFKPGAGGDDDDEDEEELKARQQQEAKEVTPLQSLM